MIYRSGAAVDIPPEGCRLVDAPPPIQVEDVVVLLRVPPYLFPILFVPRIVRPLLGDFPCGADVDISP